VSHPAGPWDMLDDGERAALRARIQAGGLVSVAEALGMARETVARLCAGLAVRRGTVALARAWLAK